MWLRADLPNPDLKLPLLGAKQTLASRFGCNSCMFLGSPGEKSCIAEIRSTSGTARYSAQTLPLTDGTGPESRRATTNHFALAATAFFGFRNAI